MNDDIVIAAARPQEASEPAAVTAAIAQAEVAYAERAVIAGTPRFAKRAIDVVVSGLALLLLAPLLLVVAVLVKLTSSGPALFTQIRLGKDAREFRVLKFRTMVADAEARLDELVERNEGGNLLFFKIQDDPRITPVGRWLRKLSIDELPQLINVLRGDMSLVGPRPLHGRLDGHSADYGRRLVVRPGITGLWQVSGRSTVGADDAVRLDLEYIENWSLALDARILVRTVGAVVRSEGAY